MKKLTGLLPYFLILIFSCDNQSKPTQPNDDNTNSSEPKQEVGKLNDYLKKQEEPSQTFTIISSKPTQVKGKKGIIISVNPNDLATVDGNPIGKNIQIEIKELTDQRQLLRTNAQTVSNGQLLVSGGAYYINMTSNGQQLKLKDGKSLSVVFPKLADKEMTLFYGQRDSLGKINWQKSNETFTSKQPKDQSQNSTARKTGKKQSDIDAIFDYIDSSDTTMTQDERAAHAKKERNFKVEQKVYDAINIQSFGWINCDRFLEIEDKTEFLVKINPSDSIIYANVYLVFKDINSVMQQYYCCKGTAKDNSVTFEGLPVGYKTRLFAYSVKDEKIYAFASDVTISKNQKLEIAMKYVTEQEFKNLLGK
jgi:hypothetical protein